MPSFELRLQFRGRRVEDRDELLEVEDALFEMLIDGEELDGHEVGAAVCSISIVTTDAQATFHRLQPFLAEAQLLDQTTAAMRPLSTTGYTLLWPVARSIVPASA
ncbi:MAG: hypothetical protein IT521_15920 [Burkholderiales bacterium]|nr:hypothetical protein [Burkholderiales bacterium]